MTEVGQKTDVLKLDQINASRFIKPADMFENGEKFVIIGFDGVKQTTINNRPATITELRIRLMSDGKDYTLSLGYNSRHDNIRDFFADNPSGSSQLLKLGKQETTKGNPAWIFEDGLEG